MNISELVVLCHKNAVEKGFYDPPKEFGTLMALIHSEVSEALEADRNFNDAGILEEMADIIIRVCDVCGHMNLDLEKAVIEKMEKNSKRPRKHNKKY